MTIRLPELSLVVLIGASGSGKSSFARRHFKPTEVLSSDHCRALVCDDENSQAVTKEAFEILRFIAAKRLAAGKLTVVDATNVQPESRKPLVELAREYHCLPVAIVFRLPDQVCHDRNAGRADRSFGPHVVRQQNASLRRSLRGLQREGFRHVFVLESEAEVDAVETVREPLWNNRRTDHGPFDIVGDVHGCCDELEELLATLGYERPAAADPADAAKPAWRHPQGRRVIFLGDLGDRGPRILDSFRTAMDMVAAGTALCVPGNHDIKLLRKLRGKDVQITHGLDRTLAELDALPAEQQETFRPALAAFIDQLISHYVLDDGKLVVAHAGLKAEMQGRGSGAVREFCLFGETTGETDEFGLPVRYNWAAEYRGAAHVVYGHTPVPEPQWFNRTLNIDTGCVFGGRVTALRYPEMELVSVPARATYCQPVRPFLPAEQAAPALTAQQAHDDLLDLDDVLGKRIIEVRLHPAVTVREEHAAAAIEAMSRFAVDPRWLIYLPPTMSPCATHGDDGPESPGEPAEDPAAAWATASPPPYLEHPAEAFAHFRHAGIPKVICQHKHMGSRAIVVVCRDRDAARSRFGVLDDRSGVVYTRTGRPFFADAALEADLLASVQRATTVGGLWDELHTDWLCLDCELMPWSAKAQELIRQQYAAVGAAARVALAEACAALDQAAARCPEAEPLRQHAHARRALAAQFTAAYRRYCWPVQSLADLRLAPFHLLASEGVNHATHDHLWHMQTLGRLCAAGAQAGAPLHATGHTLVDLTVPASEADGVRWWEHYTDGGGEGMVVKPLDFIARNRRGVVQPALKVRGREYLRIIYGPEYTHPPYLARLRRRALGHKRSLALREFALGIEGLERFIRREPLRRVHECVFGVLALESEPVDPRL